MKIKLNEKGLIPAIAQDEATGEILMVAYMSPESLRRTLDTGEAWFYSRSRQELWHKGDTSGNVIHVSSVEVDCDGDTLLLKSSASGPACHTGKPTCFFQSIEESVLDFDGTGRQVLDELFALIEDRKQKAPQGSYVANLLRQGVDRIGKKVIEEAGETVIAAKNGQDGETIHEVADLWFHSLILLSSAGLTLDDIWDELRKRRK